MRLGERLSGFIRWPISRKLFLLGSVGVFATALAALVNAAIFSTVHTSTMNLDLLNGYMAVWIVAQVLVTAAAIPAARAGREGKWAACLFIVVQSPFIVGLLHLFGTMGNPLVAIYPAIIILWTLVLDEWIGLFGFCNLVAWMIVVGVLEAQHRLPYAPLLRQRTIDAQNDPVWFAAVFFHILVLLGFCISLCVLFQRTRRGQERRLRQTHEALERANRLIRRYVPPHLADQISTGLYVETAKPERRKLSITFTGVECFATAAEELEAEDRASMLSEYLSEMVAIADRHGGTVSHVAGDGIMIFFGAPNVTSDRDHALRAVRMALEMQDRVGAMQDMWKRYGLDRPFRIRVGINTGYASVGDFGSEGRKFFSGIGLQTNLAERIQAGCGPGKVLISHSTWALVHDEVCCTSHMEMPLNGAGQPLRVYELVPNRTALADTPSVVTPPEPAALEVPQQAPLASRPGGGSGNRIYIGATRIWTFENARFDEGSLELTVGEELVVLERKPLEVLRYLLRHAGDVVTKDELSEAVWSGRILSDTVIAKCVSRLREALRDDDQRIIKTAHGYGYRFVAEIRIGPSKSATPPAR